jgi:DNA-binding Lrp family transcriptional regulator
MDKDQIIDKRGFDYTRIEEEFIDSVGEFDIYEKVIYMVLCRHANIYNATAFPSYKTISEKAGISRSKTIEVIKSMVLKGIINKIENVNSKGENTSNTYEILGYKNRTLYKLPPKPPKKGPGPAKKKKAEFDNFENRTYDAKSLEEQMLEASKNDLIDI